MPLPSLRTSRILPLLGLAAILAVFLATGYSWYGINTDNSVISSRNNAFAQNVQQPSTEVNATASTSGAAKAKEHTISVSGTATIKAIPDRAIVIFAVETRDNTAKAALAKNSEVMNNVLAALEGAGVQKNETSTAYFNIYPIYNYTHSGNVQSLQGYTVTNSLTISSAKTQNVSSWIDAAVQAGANRVDNVQFIFSSEQLAKIRSDLIKGAIDDARSKADVIAAKLGVEITGVQSVVSNDSGFPGPYYSAQTQLVQAPPVTPIIVGGQEVSASVNIVYIMS
jgi:uncharacterized protein YggE